MQPVALECNDKTKKPKRKLDSHEHRLLKAKRTNSKMEILLMNGDTILGVVKDFDKYSVLIKRSTDGKTVALFKHGIIGFYSAQDLD